MYVFPACLRLRWAACLAINVGVRFYAIGLGKCFPGMRKATLPPRMDTDVFCLTGGDGCREADWEFGVLPVG